jgi:hypothetical protein
VLNKDRCEPPLPEEQVRKVARSVGQYEPADDATAQGGDGLELPTAADLILGDLLERSDPAFRRGPVIFSAKLGREVKAAEAAYAPTEALLATLAMMFDLSRGQLYRVYRDEAKTAWVELLARLPEEVNTAEVSEGAAEQFRARVKAALLTIVSLGYAYRQGKDERTEVERRPVIKWAIAFAKDGAWGDMRGLSIWSRREKGTRRLRVAIQVSLFRQIHAAGLPETQRQFAGLARLYGVGRERNGTKIKGGRDRALELTEEFLAELTEAPDEDASDSRTDNDGATRVREESGEECPS